MVRRLGSALVLLIMLSVIALGDGRYFAGDREDCGSEMAHQDQHHPAQQHGCDLPWSPGCASAAACVQPAPTVTAMVAAEARVIHAAPLTPILGIPSSADLPPEPPPPRA